MGRKVARGRDERRLRILIVEDEALVALEMEGILSDAGYEVVGIADDRESALRAAGRGEPDLALVDIRLANGSSGLDVAADLDHNGVCCLFVTGNCPAERGREHSFGCLHKPFTERVLVEAVSAAGQLMRGGWPEHLPRGMHLY